MKKIAKISILVALFLTLSALGALAQTDTAEKPVLGYPNVAAIPEPLKSLLVTSDANQREQFLITVDSYIRRFGRTKQALDQQDVDSVRQRELHEKQLAAVKEILRYDANLDGAVTADEVTQTVAASGGKDADAMIHYIMKLDTDRDGKVSMPEMSALPANTPTPVSSSLQAFLALDPNKDGQLTIEELELLARKAFRTVDANDDGAISTDEIIAQTGGGNPDCRVLPAAEDETTVFLSANEGSGIPNVSVAGQSAVTGAVPVDIGDGPGKLYLIFASRSAMIWDISGNVDRVSRVIALGPRAPKTRDIAAGVAGVDAAKVAFGLYTPCVPYLETIEANGVSDVMNQLRIYLQRKVDAIMGGISMSRVNIASGEPTLAPLPKKDDIGAPAGVDPIIWKQFVEGGSVRSYELLDFSAKPVISNATVLPYKVLPGWAGIAQLVHDGSIVTPGALKTRSVNYIDASGSEKRVTDGGNIYKIVKEIPYFPPGFEYGGFTYIIATGIPMPLGDPGACAISEETGQPVSHKEYCMAVGFMAIHGH